MAKVTMLNMAGAEAGVIELKDEIFGIEPNANAVHTVVVNYLANQRQGTQSAKTRGDVRGGGRKPFRQKGTGRHRQGHSTDPSQIGGGIVFAPKPRDYRYTLPKKLRRLAMKSALSSKVAEKEIIVLDELKFDAPKTKEMIKVLENVKAGKKALIVMDTLLKESNGFQHPSSKSKDFTSMQYRFLDGESVMVPNGDWLINEMKEGYSEQEIANLDVKLMKTPVISSISENLSYYNEDKPFDELTQAEQAEYDAILSQIVKDVDAGKQSSDVCSEADFERVKEARMMIPSEGNVHLAVVPSYCDQTDLAKSFLKLMYSEEGAKIFARETLGCRLPMRYSFTTESDGLFSNSVNSVSDGATWIFKYNYKTELFTKYGLRILAPNVSNFVQLMSASNSNDYKGAYSIYNESKTYFENRWEEMVK